MRFSHLVASALRRQATVPASRPTSSLSASSTTAPTRTLTLLDLTLLGIGGTLGSGLFALSGYAARVLAGPAVSLSFVIAGAVCLLSAMSFAEMSSRFPSSGGAYSFAYAALGELPAFLIGMCLTLEYGVSAAAVARAWASYLGDATSVFPPWVSGIGSPFCLLAFCLIIFIVTVLWFGLDTAKWVINTGTLLYASVVLVIIAFGSWKVDVSNLSPFVPFGIQGVVRGASCVFFAYLGFDEIATVAEEARKPSRDVPLAMLMTMFVVSSMYVLSSLVLTGVTPYTVIDLNSPFSVAMRAAGLPLVSYLVGFGTVLGLTNTCLVAFAAQARLMLSMGRDALLPRAFARSIRLTTIGCGLIVAILAFVVDTGALADIVSGAALLAFLSTNVSLLLVRARLGSPDQGQRRRRRHSSTLVFLVVGCCVLTAVAIRLIVAVGLSSWVAVASFLLTGFLVGYTTISYNFEGGDAVEDSPPSFLCPFVPGLPFAGCFSTAFLFFQLSGTSLLVLFLLLLATTVFYFVFLARESFVQNSYREIGDDGLCAHDGMEGRNVTS